MKSTDPGFDLIPQRFQKSMVHNTSSTNVAVDSPQGRKVFVFDRVFGEDVQQDGVYQYIGSSVESFVQGYNVSIMAYGQSGAGKSFTMGTSGPQEQNDTDLMGIIPRAAASLFARLVDDSHHGRSSSQLKTPNRYSMSFAGGLSGKSSVERGWQLKATYVEIYNEQLRDLLIPDGTPFEQRPIPTIREDKGRILLTNLTQIDINSVEDLLHALNHGSAVRQTDATAINARSSRSHAIFSLNLVQRKSSIDKRHSMPVDALSAEHFVTTDSKLHFVDLAGSERLKNTQASGDRAKEGISINAGLASLGKVISQLSSRQAGSHVSYRDSKLTRILQDSLGGNAITYLVACVTPAEFHLSETLNTVQYAQRARAIQSKPLIQQVSDEGDKQVVIERLRAEISFLRDQIKSSHQSGAPTTNGDRSERQGEREAELQEHLLDVQESYSALSKRHARLVSEISRAGHFAEAKALSEGEDPTERIKRSESFDQAIEQMVTEYETTIQSLETSLLSTRSQLSSSESKLSEHESKISFIETVNQQLTTRLDKIMNRESSLESYTRDLEARLDGRESSNDRKSAIVTDLRKELNRLREAEATSEDYISNLEERLAEAEQDMELMNREINRLEHVVDRQRSVGKLDTLLHELDRVQSRRATITNGSKAVADEDSTVDESSSTHNNEGQQSGSQDDDAPQAAPQEEAHAGSATPTQMQYVEEKLDAVNQELISLQVEHNSTINEYEMLAAKYEEALRTLAVMQETSERKTSPAAFLADARVRDIQNAEQEPFSRSLSSELSSVGASPITGSEDHDGNDPDSTQPRSTPATSVSSSLARPLSDLSATGVNRSSQPHVVNQQAIVRELEGLKSANAFKDERVEELSNELEEVRTEHDKTLEMVANLKADLQRAKAGTPNSPTAGHHFVRRKSGQVLSSDRTNRAFVSLGNIASEHFGEHPDVRENFTIQLNALSSEMQTRSERVEGLETELANAKKEMEAKMQIISGLARERSSMKTASPVDISVVSSMREQLGRNETHIKALQDQLGSRESELGKEIRSLKTALQELEGRTSSPTQFEPSGDESADIARLREQLNEKELRHKHEISGLKIAEAQLMETISELESTLSSVDKARRESSAELEEQRRVADAATSALEIERQRLSDELEQQRATVKAHASRYADLQQAYEALGSELDQHSGFNEATVGQLENHRSQIGMLEQHIQSQYDAIEQYKETIKEMAENHARELDHLQTMLAQEDGDDRGVDDSETDVHQRMRAADDARASAEGNLAALQVKVSALAKLEDQLKAENNELRERERRASRLVEELEGQITSSFEDNKQNTSRLSTIQQTNEKELNEAKAAVAKAEQQISELTVRLQIMERTGTPVQQEFGDRTNSMQSRKSIGLSGLPSPPPAMPLPPLPANVPQSPFAATFADREGRPTSPPVVATKRDSATQARLEEQEARIKTIEKHLFAEKQLTATLEEALVDVESQSEKVKKEADTWRKKAAQIEQELSTLKDERSAVRHSVQQMEDERNRRLEAERAQARLEEKMAIINKKKKGKLNCF